MNISYIELNSDQIDLIEPLWENLTDHHRDLSKHFKERYAEFEFQNRKEELLNKSENGILKIDIAQDNDSDEVVGYCISSISDELIGEIDSIYLDKNYRSSGIGNKLMERAITWMDEKGAKTKKVMVAAGNENALLFYSRYNFFPKHIILEHVK